MGIRQNVRNGDLLPLGEHIVTYIATDDIGRAAHCTFKVSFSTVKFFISFLREVFIFWQMKSICLREFVDLKLDLVIKNFLSRCELICSGRIFLRIKVYQEYADGMMQPKLKTLKASSIRGLIILKCSRVIVYANTRKLRAVQFMSRASSC